MGKKKVHGTVSFAGVKACGKCWSPMGPAWVKHWRAWRSGVPLECQNGHRVEEEG